MPPKAKCTKEDIIKAAFDMTREKGIESVAAREVGKRLGTSSTPIFTHFKNMYELKLEVRKLAMQQFEAFVADAFDYSPAFKQFGIRMVQFAIEEPKLFQVLYMMEHEEGQNSSEMFKELGDMAEKCVRWLQKEYNLTEEEAMVVFRHTWMHTFSVCVLEANKICQFTEEEISEILSIGFKSVLSFVKSGNFKKISQIKHNNEDK